VKIGKALAAYPTRATGCELLILAVNLIFRTLEFDAPFQREVDKIKRIKKKKASFSRQMPHNSKSGDHQNQGCGISG
jgi:hypothetical protein